MGIVGFCWRRGIIRDGWLCISICRVFFFGNRDEGARGDGERVAFFWGALIDMRVLLSFLRSLGLWHHHFFGSCRR